MTKESRRVVQLKLRQERGVFKLKLKIHLTQKMISQHFLCDKLKISDQEFHNMLTGYQSSVPKKNILSYKQFQDEIFEALKITKL